jgi:hypothetical protein
MISDVEVVEVVHDRWDDDEALADDDVEGKDLEEKCEDERP